MRFRSKLLISFIFTLGISVLPLKASAELCDASARFCGFFGGHSSSSGGAPQRGSKIRINPSAVPLEDGLGVEALYFDNSVDFAIVKGLGRIGAAISPSNSDETFFGPPGVELSLDFLQRKQGHHKLANQKYTLATAFGLYTNNRQGLDRVELNLGVMGKYNTVTGAVLPGGGVRGVLGPLTFGYSVYKDQTQIDYASYGLNQKEAINAHVESYSVGAYLNSLAVDYSLLREITTEAALVSVVTGTLILKRGLFTYAVRRESSNRPYYNPETQQLETRFDKTTQFLGAQLMVTKSFMFGVFHNYYLHQELSLGATLFF